MLPLVAKHCRMTHGGQSSVHIYMCKLVLTALVDTTVHLHVHEQWQSGQDGFSTNEPHTLSSSLLHMHHTYRSKHMNPSPNSLSTAYLATCYPVMRV